MAVADEFLKDWVIQLAAMQACMAPISNDTDAALGKFCARKPSDLLPSAATQSQLGICMSNVSNMAVPASAIAAAATFRALLDTCFRPLINAILAAMRAQATDDGGNFGTMPLNQFDAVKISVAFPTPAAIDGLCNRLAAASTPTAGASPLFPANDPAFREILASPGATVLQAAQSLPVKPAAATRTAGPTQ
jgi:hypothetical protein